MKFLVCLILFSTLHADPQVPPGFQVSIFAEVPSARSMAVSSDGTVYVGTRDGAVYAALDADLDGRAEEVVTLAENLFMPNGVALKDGDLYVAEVHRILKFPSIRASLRTTLEPQVIFKDLPSDSHHGWKYIRFSPSGDLYIPVGAPCNICDPDLPYAALHRLNLQTLELEVVARGIRNTVGFDFHPKDQSLWFTDNGRDWMGDHLPPEELNRLSTEGEHFGYPFCHAGTIADPEFGHLAPCSQSSMPRATFTAHTAALGMKFVESSSFPEKYQEGAFIAQHGSWNRSEKAGYQVRFVKIDGSRVVRNEVFLNGFLQDEEVSGRPVDVAFHPDGSLLVSDDYAGRIYLIKPQ